MSSEDTILPGVPVNTAGDDAAGDTEDVNQAPIETQAEVHVDAKREDNGTAPNDGHSNGTEIDPISSETSDVLAPLGKQMSTESTGHVRLDSGNSVTFSPAKEKDDSFIVQISEPRKTPSSPRKTPTSPLSRQTSLLGMLRRDSSLSLQESWKSKSATTRLKSKKNYISFHNITYTVPQGWFFQDKPPKLILNDISGIMRVGVNAIMGPSGSGKSSLLDVLADRKDRSRVSGHVLINGEKQPHNFKCASGYVVQDDILSGTLTVKENVYLSASLRLPWNMDRQEKEEKVDEVIEELGLSHVANTMVGTPFTRGVSGGQRKRCSIAIEMVVSPAVLFLDEPTTGLDSTTAESVIQTLHNLSKDGRVIVMSIHQPRYSIFRLCDHITLLSRGNLVYTGAGRATLPYFAEVLGLECDAFDNPADFFLDKMNEAEEDLKPPNLETGDTGNPLANKWLASENCQLLNVELDPLLQKAIDQPDGIAPKYATNPLVQSYYLFGRAVKNLFRNPAAGGAVLMMNIILGFFSGIIFFQLEDDGPNVFLDRSGALFFCLICNLFSVTAGLELFISERPLFIHENSSGYYRVSSYYLSKLFGDLIPLRVVPIPIFVVIAYWMIGFQADAGKFFLFLLGVVFQNVALTGLVYTVGAAVGALSAAQILVNVFVILSMVFGGFFVSLDSVPVWLSWLQWLSFFKYSFTILAENELEDTRFCVAFEGGNCIDVDLGDDFLRQLDFLDYNIWFNFLGLGLMALATLISAYVFLVRIKKTT